MSRRAARAHTTVPRPSDPPGAAIALAVGAAVVFLIAFARLWDYVLDDTFISLRYAQHLAEGRGLVYNPGERVEGYSNFLWTLLLALPHALGLPPVPFLKTVIAAVTLAAAWFTVRLGRASGLAAGGRADRWLAWMPAALFLLTPLVVERAADGLETLPFTLLLVMAVTWTFEAGRPGGATRLGLALAALVLMRPDGVLFAPVLLAAAAARGLPPGRTLRSLLWCAAPLALYAIARHAYYGDWLPNTYYAKRGGGEEWRYGLERLAGFLSETGAWAWLAALPALVLRRSRAAAAVLLAAIAARVAFHVWAGGAWIGLYRFLTPILPLLYLLVAAGIAAIPRPRLRPLALATVVVLLLGPAWLRYPEREADALAYGRGLEAAHGTLGRTIRERTAPEAVIAMDDAGLGPYLARRRNVDMLGLNDRHIARLPGRFSRKYDIRYVLDQRPDLIVLVSTVEEPTRSDQLPLPGHAAMVMDSVFLARYDLLRVHTMRADYHLGVFRRRDSQAVPAGF